MHGWHEGGTGQERYAMSPASSLALYRSLCFLVEQCPVRKCANRRTWNWRQRAGGNLQLCVCKSNSHRSRPPKSCFSKRFWIGDWEGSVTAHILDMYGYGWEVGAFLYSFAWECVRYIEKRKWLISLHSPPALTPGVGEKSFRPNQSESDFLNASDLANIPRDEQHTYIQSTVFKMRGQLLNDLSHPTTPGSRSSWPTPVGALWSPFSCTDY